jgi:hypothetical protein
MRTWVSVQWGEFQPLPGPPLSPADLAEGVTWPCPIEWVIRFIPDESPHAIDVEVMEGNDGSYDVTGISVRATTPTSPGGTLENPWLEGGQFDPIVARDVQRLPLTQYTRAAIAIIKSNRPFSTEHAERIAKRIVAERIVMPRGRPSKGVGPEFYLELLAVAKELEKQGIRPVPEIAKRKRVNQNLVHQWLHRARKLAEERSGDGPADDG